MQTLRAFGIAVSMLVAVVPGAAAEPFESADQFAEHLKFLGYTVEEREDHLLGRHQVHFPVTVSQLRGGVLLRAYVLGAEWAEVDRRGFLEVINGLNEEATAIRFYADVDSDLASEAWYPGGYDRERFGVLIDEFNTDMERLSDMAEEEMKFFE